MAEVAAIYLPDDLYYDPKNHLWLRVESGRVRIGLDQFGQKAAGTVAYIKLLPAGKQVRKGRAFGSLEAGKYIGPLKAQVSGVIVDVNSDVVTEPTLVNTDPYGRGWFVVMEPSDLEADLQDRVHGAEAIRAWLEREYREYTEKGLFAEE
ncbi:MAG: glycine cleavage system protein H [Candidatus Methylomirabilales bacterium]